MVDTQQMSIQEKTVLFTNILRNQGMLISIRTTSMAAVLLQKFENLFDEKEIYYSLKAVYLKDMSDEDKFNKAYREVFLQKEEKQRQKIKRQQTENTTTDATQNLNIKNKQQDNPFEAVETIKKDKEEGKIQVNKVTNDSLIMLDGADPRVFEACKRLSKKVANMRSIRRKKANKQHICMSKTIRCNIKYGGHIIQIIKDTPPMKKTNHIFLCDISGSCEWITSWFFAILYGCQRTFTKMRIYDFDNKLVDVTNALKEDKYQSIGQINMAHRRFGGNPYGQSDMTNSFRELLKNVDLNNRTDIIILTDCRDWKGKRENGVLESAKILGEVSKKVHKIMILNPEKKIRWNNATSCVRDYEKVGIPVYEAGTLEQFARVISRL